MQQVQIRSTVLAQGGARPRSCVRHGQPVIDGGDIDLQSRPKHDMTPTFGGVFAIAVRTADHLQEIKRVPMQGWPFCARCVRRRRQLRRTAQLLFFGGIALAVAAGVVSLLLTERQPLLIIPILGGIAAAIGSGFVFGQSSWSHIAGAVVSNDGLWVTFPSAHPQFAAEMRSAGGH